MRRLYTTVIILFDSYEVTKSSIKVKAVNPSFVLCLSILMTGYMTISCKRPLQNPIDQKTQPTVTASVPLAETPEAKAVRLAEEFIARNGYTDLPPDKKAISHETVEFAENKD